MEQKGGQTGARAHQPIPQARLDAARDPAAPHPVAAHAWINWLLERRSRRSPRSRIHSYPIPIPAALDQMPAETKNDPIFNVPATYTDNYEYILNPNPQLVNARTKIYQQLEAA